MRNLQWRNRNLDFQTLDRLRDSLRELPRETRLTRARMADDVLALEAASGDREIVDMAARPAAVMQLWDVCQIPDYRKISSQNHAELVATIYKYLMGPEAQCRRTGSPSRSQFADRTDGDIDTLANRIAHIRTWTFVSNRADWLKDPEHWQERTRADRGQSVGRAARMPDAALRRPAHERADEGHARQGGASGRDRRRRRDSTSRTTMSAA